MTWITDTIIKHYSSLRTHSLEYCLYKDVGESRCYGERYYRCSICGTVVLMYLYDHHYNTKKTLSVLEKDPSMTCEERAMNKALH